MARRLHAAVRFWGSDAVWATRALVLMPRVGPACYGANGMGGAGWCGWRAWGRWVGGALGDGADWLLGLLLRGTWKCEDPLVEAVVGVDSRAFPAAIVGLSGRGRE